MEAPPQDGSVYSFLGYTGPNPGLVGLLYAWQVFRHFFGGVTRQAWADLHNITQQ